MRSNHSNISKIAKREIEDRYYGRRHSIINIQRAIKNICSLPSPVTNGNFAKETIYGVGKSAM